MRAAVAAATALLLVAAAPAPVQSHLDIAWVSPPGETSSGGDLVARIDWDLNDPHGVIDEPAPHAYILEVTVTSGVVSAMPELCTEASVIASSGRHLTCVLALPDDDGAMGSIDIPVSAWGGEGDNVEVTVSDGVREAVTLPIPLTATRGLDVAVNARALAGADYAFEPHVRASAVLPVMVSIPRGGLPLDGEAVIDLEITTQAGPDVLAGAEFDIVPVPSDERVMGIAANGPDYLVPQVRTRLLDARTVRLTVDLPDGAGPGPVRDPAGNLLDVLPQASFGLQITYPLYSPVEDNDASMWTAQIAAVEASAGGKPLTEQLRLTNDEAVTSLVDTGGSSARFANGPAPAAGGLIAAAGRALALPEVFSQIWDEELSDLSAGADGWSGNGPVLPGDQLIGVVSTSRYAGTNPQSYQPSRHGLCLLFDDSAPFTGATAVRGLTSYDIQYRRGPAPLDEPDCSQGAWEDSVDEPTQVGAVRLLFDPSVQEDILPARVEFAAGYRVAQELTEGELAWMAGMALAGGDWYDSGEPLAEVGGAYGATTTFRDAVKVRSSRISVELSAADEVLVPGGSTIWTVDTLVSAAPFNDRDRATVDHRFVLPEGFSARLGRSADIHVDKEANHEVLTWTEDVTIGEVSSVQIATRHLLGAGTASARVNARNRDAQAMNEAAAEADVAVIQSAGLQLHKEAASSTFALDGSNRWTVRLANRQATPVLLADTVDVLPWAGDGRGTVFSGRALVTDLIAPEGTDIWVTRADPATIDADPAGHAHVPTAPWELWDHQDGITAVRWISTDIAPGGELAYLIDYEVEGATNGDRLVNSAQTRSGQSGTMINSMDTALVGEPAAIQVDKRVLSSGLREGESVDFEITVRGGGPGTARGVVVEDLPGDGLSDIRFTEVEVGEISADGGRWVVGDLPAGRTFTASLTGTATDSSLENTVIARSCTDPDCEIDPPATCTPNVDAASDTDQCDIVRLAEEAILQIDKEIAGPLPPPGEQATFVLTVRNGAVATAGSITTASDVTIRDLPGEGIVPGTILFADPSLGRIEDGQWLIDQLEAGQSATVTVLATVDDSPAVTNAAWVENPGLPRMLATPLDAVPNVGVAADTDQADVLTVHRAAHLAIDKAVTSIDGGSISYTITVGNLGGQAAAEVTVTDLPGDNLTDVRMSDPSSGDIDGLVWHLGTLEPGERHTVTVTGVSRGPAVTNQAHVDAPDLPHRGLRTNETLEADDDQGDTVTVALPPADLRLDKRIISSGDPARFEIEVCNFGEGLARDVTVTDRPGPGMTELQLDGAEAGTGTVLIGDLPPSQCSTIDAVAQIAGESRNIAFVDSPDDPIDPDAHQVNDSVVSDTDGWDAVEIRPALPSTGASHGLIIALAGLSFLTGGAALAVRRGR